MGKTEDLIIEFKTALREEIEFIKKQGSGSKFTARNGILVEDRHNKFIYQFIIDDPSGLPDDVPIQVRYGQNNVQGSIVAIEGIKILIALDENIGNKVSEITIVADPYYLLEILNRRLEEVENKSIKINLPLAEKLFGFSPSQNDELYDFEIQDFTPNKQQNKAIAKSLGSDVTFIWGPPGTGKTRTLSTLAEILLNKGMTVLILSHTNIAVDNAINQIAKVMEKRENKEYNDGKILRLGNATEGLFDKFPKVDINHWIGKKSKELIKKRDGLELELREYETELSEKKKVLRLYADINELQSAIDKSEQEYLSLDQERKDAEFERRDYKDDLRTIERRLTKTIGMSKIKRFFLGINIEKLERRKEELKKLMFSSEEKINTIKSSIKILIDQLEVKKRKIESLNENLYAITKSLPIVIHCKNKKCNQRLRVQPKGFSKGLFTCPTCNQKFEYTFSNEDINKQRFKEETEELSSYVDDLRSEITEINARISQIETEILKDVRLLATTLTKGYTEETIYTRQFDVVIVDEVSMAPLPVLFFDCGLAAQKLIVIGDFRQLAPIARSDTELANRWLKRDIFDQVGIIDDVENDIKRQDLVQLVEQHRMNYSIMETVNGPIYDGKLEQAPKDDENLEKEANTVLSEPFGGHDIAICDTSTFNPWCSMTSNRSPFNVYSAFLSLHLAEIALKSVIEEEDIGVISPYTAQTKLLHKMAIDRNLKIDVASIHRFQGREKELIIFDLVEGPVRQIRWLGSEDRRTDAGRLVNVAITRAKSKLILIANVDYLKKKLTEGSILKKILTTLCENYQVVDANTFFDFLPDAYDIEKMMDGEKLLIEDVNVDDRTYFFSQAYFYTFFYRDLQNCKKEVIIFSPFITTQRVDSLINHFKKLLSNGIRVIIITRPPSEQIKYIQESVNEILDYFRECGIDVIRKRRMHEKLAIIDKNIIWQGSLNILSHKNTTELMTRIKTKETKTSEEILKLFGINVDRIAVEEEIKSRIRNLNKKGFGFCPKCGSKMVVKRGKYGLFLSCENFRKGCKETMQVDERIIEVVYGEDYLICECGARMKIKYNPKRRSRFLACPNYPKHKFTRPI